jgi:DNA-binding GntR family transcriptional regulator
MSDAVATGSVDHLGRTNFAERVAADLRRAILRGELLPGEHVGQEQWAARFGVSRVPLREALKILTTQRLLSHDPHRGYFVTTMGDSEVEQIYRLRIFIEPEVMRSIRPTSAAELNELEATLDRMETCILARRFADALDEERLFFFALFDMSPLGFLATEAKRLWDISEPYRSELNLAARTADPSLGRVRKTRREMLEVIRNGDREELGEIVRTQRRNALEFFTAG